MNDLTAFHLILMMNYNLYWLIAFVILLIIFKSDSGAHFPNLTKTLRAKTAMLVHAQCLMSGFF